ncbi:helix-turn-helix transcriptional regulator (plasmid) [Rhizobium pusense]|uniref:Helix-turn-helix transcriptional regulator n=3 Tax=Agrobacterium pusense TaxID=648995 RepID=A0AA44IXL3_9HYPH|nr:helix-turn-helix transcriptional regulator [Agrobacterium pusense]NRF18399.1 helix-turn-helix transcriptional regulator [Agrobacterium pusense]
MPGTNEGMILRAAMDEIVAHGLDVARIDTIARRAESNKRMIYHHFGDKEGLYLQVLDRAFEKMRTWWSFR